MRLANAKRKPGPNRLVWFDDVTRAAMLICEHNGMSSAVTIDRIDPGRAVGYSE